MIASATIPAPITAPAAPWHEQIASLRVLAQTRDVHTIVLRNPLNLSWFTGARWQVPQTLAPACFDVVVSGLQSAAVEVRIVANTIEAPRLRDTEFAGRDVSFETVPWQDDRARLLPFGVGVASDVPGPGLLDLSSEIDALRRVLSRGQQLLLGALARDTARITGAVAAASRPKQTEQHIAGQLVAALLDEGVECVALFVGSDERIGVHRHPLPTGKTVSDRIMVACCGRRQGLVASVTRMVSFTPLGAEADRYQGLLNVEREFLDASVVGADLADVFTRGVSAYGRNDFDPEEWRHHHQGGLTGFNPRELIAHEHTNLTLQSGMALGWNPSGGGFKVEDTTLVTPTGATPLGTDPAWPVSVVAGRSRPAVLELT